MTVTATSRGELAAPTRNARIGLRKAKMRRKSAIAVLMTLPLILLVGILVVYPTLLFAVSGDPEQIDGERFIGFGNFLFLFKRETFWLVVEQSCIFAVTGCGLQSRQSVSSSLTSWTSFRPRVGASGTAISAGPLGHPTGDELPLPGCGCSIRPFSAFNWALCAVRRWSGALDRH